MKTARIAPFAASLSALALLAACSGSDAPPPSADANEVEMLDVTNEAMNVAELPTPTPTPTETIVNEVDLPPAPDAAQVQDDADAAGMPARVNRDTSENEVAPADVAEEKR